MEFYGDPVEILAREDNVLKLIDDKEELPSDPRKVFAVRKFSIGQMPAASLSSSECIH